MQAHHIEMIRMHGVNLPLTEKQRAHLDNYERWKSYVGMARLIAELMNQGRRWFRYREIIGTNLPNDVWALVVDGILRKEKTENGGFLLLVTPHTWPFIRYVLDSDEP